MSQTFGFITSLISLIGSSYFLASTSVIPLFLPFSSTCHVLYYVYTTRITPTFPHNIVLNILFPGLCVPSPTSSLNTLSSIPGSSSSSSSHLTFYSSLSLITIPLFSSLCLLFTLTNVSCNHLIIYTVGPQYLQGLCVLGP